MPGKVTGIVATAGDAQVELQWACPLDGDEAVSIYQ